MYIRYMYVLVLIETYMYICTCITYQCITYHVSLYHCITYHASRIYPNIKKDFNKQCSPQGLDSN